MSALTVQIVPVTSFAQNCSIVKCNATQQAAIVDPGGDLGRIKDTLQHLNATAVKILLTHGHIDHAGAAKALARELAIPIIGPHQADAFWLQGLAQQAQMFGFQEVESFLPDQWLQDGDTVQFGAVELAVIHAPGHTPGHVVFYHQAEKLAWVGDVLFQGSIGRTDFPQGDHQQLISSIVNKLFPLGDDITFIPGHGPTSTFAEEKRSNPFVSGRFG